MTDQRRARRRSDAARNREAIIAAFIELPASDGADVPLYRVARRAGVAQATLYPHFPERGLLAIAVYEQRIHHLSALAADWTHDPRAFLNLMRELVLEEARMPGLLRVLRAAAEGERDFRGLRARVLEVLAEPLERARTAGVMRRTVRLDDVQVIFAMMEGAVEEAAGRPEVAVRALELLFEGLAETNGEISPTGCPRPGSA